MTNVSGSPEKLAIRHGLRAAAEKALESKGWTVERVPGAGKSSLRRITKGGASKLVTIRTTQDQWIAFPRNKPDTAFTTLEEADLVVAASVDDKDNPRFARIHMLPGDEMRERFERNYKARTKVGYTLPKGRGIWLALYQQDMKAPVTRVAAGAGLKHPPIATLPLLLMEATGEGDGLGVEGEEVSATRSEAPLTIAEAKRRLAQSFGVPEDSVKITITS